MKLTLEQNKAGWRMSAYDDDRFVAEAAGDGNGDNAVAKLVVP